MKPDFTPKYIKKILIDRKEVEAGIAKAARWINKKYSKSKKRPILLCTLKGAIPFYGRLAVRIKIDIEFDTIQISSFRGAMHAVTEPKMLTDLGNEIKGRDVIVVEDVIDSAKTLSTLVKYLKTKKPHSVVTMALVDKVEMRKVPFKADYVCFTVKGNPFLVGYGLDIKEIARNLPYIAEFDTKYLDKI